MAAVAPTGRAQSFTCSGSSLSGQKWTGARFGGNTSLIFESADTFQYAVRAGARTMVSARGQFSIRKADERAGERFPSNCQITFTPTAVDPKPSADDLRTLQTNGLLDGSKQTFWIDRKAPRWEPEPFLELLNVVIWESDRGSVLNFTLKQQR